MKFKFIYFSISAVVIAAGIFSLLTWGLSLGVDFKGGSEAEYKIPSVFSSEKLTEEAKKIGIDNLLIQSTEEGNFIFKTSFLTSEKKEELKNKIKEVAAADIQELRFENVGPSIGPELVNKTYVALAISGSAILLWVAYQFRSVKFGLCAILAMFHDTFILVGLFSLLGHFLGAEVDFLFVTALLTVLSFSVHDTIVVYDRIREIRRRHGGEIEEIANKAVSETMRRSINNSLTIIFMLLALIILGGSSIKWFAVALLIGTISGTYSSPFVAVPLLVVWERAFRRSSR